MSDYKISAAFEYREEEIYRCRYIVVWKELENSIAGMIGGYSGGGTFYEESFYCEIHDGKIKRLLIDYLDLVSKEEIDFDEEVPSFAREAIGGSYELFDEYINEDERYDADRLILNEGKIPDLFKEDDMLLEFRNDHILLPEIVAYTPITIKLN